MTLAFKKTKIMLSRILNSSFGGSRASAVLFVVGLVLTSACTNDIYYDGHGGKGGHATPPSSSMTNTGEETSQKTFTGDRASSVITNSKDPQEILNSIKGAWFVLCREVPARDGAKDSEIDAFIIYDDSIVLHNIYFSNSLDCSPTHSTKVTSYPYSIKILAGDEERNTALSSDLIKAGLDGVVGPTNALLILARPKDSDRDLRMLFEISDSELPGVRLQIQDWSQKDLIQLQKIPNKIVKGPVPNGLTLEQHIDIVIKGMLDDLDHNQKKSKSAARRSIYYTDKQVLTRHTTDNEVTRPYMDIINKSLNQ